MRKTPPYTVEEAKFLMHEFGLKLKGFTYADVAKGLNVEREHADVTHNDAKMTLKIALAHLHERPDYYDLLEKMERAPLTRRR